MPYKLRKAPRRDLYWVISPDGKHHSKDPLPKERAQAQLRALYAAETKKDKLYESPLEIVGGQNEIPVPEPVAPVTETTSVEPYLAFENKVDSMDHYAAQLGIPTLSAYMAEKGIPSRLQRPNAVQTGATSFREMTYAGDKPYVDMERYNELMKNTLTEKEFDDLKAKRPSEKRTYQQYLDTKAAVSRSRSIVNPNAQTRLQNERNLIKAKNDAANDYYKEYPQMVPTNTKISAEGTKMEKYEPVPAFEAQRRRDLYIQQQREMNKTGWDKALDVLTGIADVGVDLLENVPGVGAIASQVYKAFPPPTSAYYDSSMAKQLGAGKMVGGVGFPLKQFLKLYAIPIISGLATGLPLGLAFSETVGPIMGGTIGATAGVMVSVVASYLNRIIIEMREARAGPFTREQLNAAQEQLEMVTNPMRRSAAANDVQGLLLVQNPDGSFGLGFPEGATAPRTDLVDVDLEGSGTHRSNVLKRYNLIDKGHSLAKLAKVSGVPKSILQQVYNRGIGAYSSQPKSVRLKGSFVKNVDAPKSKKLSKQQWAMARVYSFLDGNEKHDNDLRANKGGMMPFGKHKEAKEKREESKKKVLEGTKDSGAMTIEEMRELMAMLPVGSEERKKSLGMKLKLGSGSEKWIGKVVESMKSGAFTKQAKRAKMDTLDFAKYVLANPSKFSMTTRRRAQFVANVHSLHGAGIFNTIFNFGKKVVQRVTDVAKGIRKDYSPPVRENLRLYGDLPIQRLYIRRDPLGKTLMTAINLLTQGKWAEAQSKTPYDKMFHLSMEAVVDVDPQNSITRKITVEKNQVINVAPSPAQTQKTEAIEIKQLPAGLTINKLLEGGKNVLGSKFFPYEAFLNNCQDFILALLSGSGLSSKKATEFVKQDLEQILPNLPGYAQKVGKKLTDLGGLVDVARFGAGKGGMPSGIKVHSDERMKELELRVEQLLRMLRRGKSMDYIKAILRDAKDLTEKEMLEVIQMVIAKQSEAEDTEEDVKGSGKKKRLGRLYRILSS